MNVSLGKRWEEFVATAVAEGRYNSSSEIIREGLRLVEEREEKLRALRDRVDTAIQSGGSLTDSEIEAELNRVQEKLALEGTTE